MIRPSPEKRAAQERCKSAYEEFLAKGGKVTVLPSFGERPLITNLPFRSFGKVEEK